MSLRSIPDIQGDFSYSQDQTNQPAPTPLADEVFRQWQQAGMGDSAREVLDFLKCSSALPQRPAAQQPAPSRIMLLPAVGMLLIGTLTPAGIAPQLGSLCAARIIFCLSCTNLGKGKCLQLVTITNFNFPKFAVCRRPFHCQRRSHAFGPQVNGAQVPGIPAASAPQRRFVVQPPAAAAAGGGQVPPGAPTAVLHTQPPIPVWQPTLRGQRHGALLGSRHVRTGCRHRGRTTGGATRPPAGCYYLGGAAVCQHALRVQGAAAGAGLRPRQRPRRWVACTAAWRSAAAWIMMPTIDNVQPSWCTPPQCTADTLALLHVPLKVTEYVQKLQHKSLFLKTEKDTVSPAFPSGSSRLGRAALSRGTSSKQPFGSAMTSARLPEQRILGGKRPGENAAAPPEGLQAGPTAAKRLRLEYPTQVAAAAQGTTSAAAAAVSSPRTATPTAQGILRMLDGLSGSAGAKTAAAAAAGRQFDSPAGFRPPLTQLNHANGSPATPAAAGPWGTAQQASPLLHTPAAADSPGNAQWKLLPPGKAPGEHPSAAPGSASMLAPPTWRLDTSAAALDQTDSEKTSQFAAKQKAARASRAAPPPSFTAGAAATGMLAADTCNQHPG